jgi:hypothetical protein
VPHPSSNVISWKPRTHPFSLSLHLWTQTITGVSTLFPLYLPHWSPRPASSPSRHYYLLKLLQWPIPLPATQAFSKHSVNVWQFNKISLSLSLVPFSSDLLFIYLFVGFQVRDSGLLGKCFTIWVTPPTLSLSVYFSNRASHFAWCCLHTVIHRAMLPR